MTKEEKFKDNEKTKNEIIAFVEQSIHRGGGTPIPQKQENKWIAWLEKQAQKTNPCDGCINRKGCINCENGELRETEQKPWSEEDEKMLKTAITSCEQCGNEYAYYWLKSLKDRVQQQSHWKPSDEQLKALNTINVTGCITEVGQGKYLVELYKQLKELKG